MSHPSSVWQKVMKNAHTKLNILTFDGFIEEDMASFGLQSGHYTLSASSTKSIRISWNNYYYYRPEYARLHGSSAWMPSSSSSGHYLEVRFILAQIILSSVLSVS